MKGSIPLVLSVALILALGGLAFRSTSTAERKAEQVHRIDGILLQENLGRLANQYLLIAAKELLDFTNTRPLSLAPGDPGDQSELEAFVARSMLVNYGASLVTLEGDVLSQWGEGRLPGLDDPGFATFEDGLLRQEPGVSSVVEVGGVPVVAVGVPVMDSIGFPRALVVGYWRADTSKLQEFNEQLRYEESAKAHVVDARGTIVTSTEPEMVGTSLADHPSLVDGPISESGSLEFEQEGTSVTSLFGPVEVGQWSVVRDVPTAAYYGPIRNSRRNTDAVLAAILGVAAAALVLLNHRAAAARRRSEARFRSLVQNASDIITVVDGQGRIIYDSPAVTAVLRYEPRERVGDRLREYVHPERSTWLDSLDEELMGTPGAVVRGEVPVRRGDGTWCWLEVTACNMLHDQAVRGIIVNQRDISERITLHQQLTHQAYHDSLTGLPNRALFNSRLEEALAAQAPGTERGVGVLFLDLDRFKVINDSLGHEGGDRLLVEVAARLSRVLRRGDTLARISGDEFAVLLVHATEREAVEVGERLIDVLRAPFVIDGKEVVVGTSVGVAMAEADQQPEELLRHADLAMYKAKQKGRRCCEVFQPDLGEWSRQRLELETELRRAVVDGELVLHYQPEVDVASGQVLGFEALVRWNHPERGLLQPGQFVSIAEETGLIVPLGEWVLREACRQVARWRETYPDFDLRVSVNVANRQLQQPGLVDAVRAALAETRIPAPALVLELTEGVLMEDPEATITILRELRQMGVGLAIDDFGTGYSSLAYLKHFPITSLKLDRSFVLGLCDDSSDAAIAEAIVQLAHSLRVPVTAEGVEMATQLERLRAMHCDRAQGFHFARPMPAADASAMLRERPVVSAG